MTEPVTISEIEIRFWVPGIPKPQPRPRAFAMRIKGTGKSSARVYNPGTAEAWKNDIAIAAREHIPAQPLTGPILCAIDFFLPRPNRLMRKKDPDGAIRHYGKTMDRDNLDKAVLDALTHLGFWHDDGQVCTGGVRKFYHAKESAPGAYIQIQQVSLEVWTFVPDRSPPHKKGLSPCHPNS